MSYRDTVATVTAFAAMRAKKPSAIGFQRRIHIGAEPPIIPAPRLDAEKFKGVAERRAKNFQVLHDIAQKTATGELPSILESKDKFIVISFKASRGTIPTTLPVTEQRFLMDLYNRTSDDMLTDPDMDYVAAFDKTAKDFPSPVQEVTPVEFIPITIREPGTVTTKEVVREGQGGAGTGVAIAVLATLGVAAVASKKR